MIIKIINFICHIWFNFRYRHLPSISILSDVSASPFCKHTKIDPVKINFAVLERHASITSFVSSQQSCTVFGEKP